MAVSVLCSEERPHFVTQACLTNARTVCALLCPATHCIESSLHLKVCGSVLLVGEKVGFMYRLTFHSQESKILVNYFTAYFSTD